MATMVADVPLAEIRRDHEYFGNPGNAPMLLVASDKTRYAWQHMCAFEPTLQVPRDGPVSALREAGDESIGGIPFTVPGSSPTTVADYFANSAMDALLALKQGTVVYERYKTMRPFDKHNWFSVSKTVAGTLTALLAHEDRVDITEPVSRYVTELTGSAWDGVSVEAAMDMATGLDATEFDEQPVDDGRTNPERGWFRWAVSIGLFQGADGQGPPAWEILRGMKRVKPPHTAYEYNSIDTHVLERVINAVTGKDVPELLSERAWRKIGAQNDAYIGVNRYGLANSFGFVSSVLRDLGRWGLLFTPSWGKVAAQQVVPGAVIADIQAGGRPGNFGKGRYGTRLQAMFPGVSGLANRFQWDIVFPDGDFAKFGAGGQGLYICPRNDAVVAWFSTGTRDSEHGGLVLGRAIAERLTSMLANWPGSLRAGCAASGTRRYCPECRFAGGWSCRSWSCRSRAAGCGGKAGHARTGGCDAAGPALAPAGGGRVRAGPAGRDGAPAGGGLGAGRGFGARAA